MTEEERIFAGQLFQPGDPALRAMKAKAHQWNLDYNNTPENEAEKREAMLRELLGSVGEGAGIHSPVFFHYGCHTHIGKHFFANFHMTIQDDAPVTIGDNCNFGPNVTIVTPVHPLLPSERRAMRDKDGSAVHVCYALPVSIGADCWLGAGVTVCSGVTIGKGCVIGAGSVVTKDIPPFSFAAGVPCRVIREITEADSMNNRPERLGEYSVIE